MLRSTSSWPRSPGSAGAIHWPQRQHVARPAPPRGRSAYATPDAPRHSRACALLSPEGSNPHLRTSHEEAEHPFTWCAARLGQRLGHGSLRMVATARLPIRRPRSAHVPRTGSRRGIHMREQPGHAHSQVRPRRRGVQPGVRDDGCCHRAQHAHHRSLRIARLAPGQPTELEDAARRRVHVALEFPTIRKFPALTASRP
jgi:hypothetical protein